MISSDSLFALMTDAIRLPGEQVYTHIPVASFVLSRICQNTKLSPHDTLLNSVIDWLIDVWQFVMYLLCQ
jgi:hypothetical protein